MSDRYIVCNTENFYKKFDSLREKHRFSVRNIAKAEFNEQGDWKVLLCNGRSISIFNNEVIYKIEKDKILGTDRTSDEEYEMMDLLKNNNTFAYLYTSNSFINLNEIEIIAKTDKDCYLKFFNGLKHRLTNEEYNIIQETYAKENEL